MAPNGPKSWPKADSPQQWLVFYRLDDMTLTGTGTIEGNGEQWWQLPCKPHMVLGLISLWPMLFCFYNKCNYCSSSHFFFYLNLLVQRCNFHAIILLPFEILKFLGAKFYLKLTHNSII